MLRMLQNVAFRNTFLELAKILASLIKLSCCFIGCNLDLYLLEQSSLSNSDKLELPLHSYSTTFSSLKFCYFGLSTLFLAFLLSFLKLFFCLQY